MALLREVGCRQIKLLGKITRGNSSLERSGLKREKDLEETKQKIGSERKVEKPEWEAEREMGEEAKPEQKAENEKKEEAGPKQKAEK